jgi:hypothetical protein
LPTSDHARKVAASSRHLRESVVNPTHEISSDHHNFMFKRESGEGEGLELTAHDDGGITIATAYRQPDFCDATQASLTREQAMEMIGWLSRVLNATVR